MEIEKKYLLKELPDFDNFKYHKIEQAYLCTNPVVRVRREDDTYYMTYKGSGMFAREEYNLPLNKEAYEHLKAKADGNVIGKTRYLVPLEQEGLVERVMRGSVRYRAPLKLTARGQDAAARVEAQVKRAVEKAGAGMSDAHRVVFYQVLGLIAGNLQAICEEGLENG